MKEIKKSLKSSVCLFDKHVYVVGLIYNIPAAVSILYAYAYVALWLSCRLCLCLRR